jgi:V/A-type H+-transporting ATPase subunit I
MIVPMKKLTLVCLAQDQGTTLSRLRDIGMLHIVPTRVPAATDLEKSRTTLTEIRRAIESLKAVSSQSKCTPVVPLDVKDVPKSVADLLKRKALLAEQLHELARERDSLLPFGDFSLASVKCLSDCGITVRIYQAPRMDAIRPSKGAVLKILGVTGAVTSFALIGKGALSCDGATEIAFPGRSLSTVTGMIVAAEREMSEIGERQALLASSLDSLLRYEQKVAEETELMEAAAGMGERAQVVYIQGFLPADAVDCVTREARTCGWGILVSNPAPDESVPTLIRMPRWIRPIQSLFDMIKILPGYREVDVSGAFLLFLSVFFALIVGDAGYGFVFLALTAWAHRKLRKTAPSEPFTLMYVFSACTIIWGALNGTYFGLTNNILPLPGLQFVATWLGDTNNVINMCLLIGAVHLTVAHLWSGIRVINTPQALAQAGWIAVVWTIYFLARMMLINIGAPSAVWAIGVAGIVLIILFMTPPAKLKTEWINHAMLPLSLMSNFGDILSYLRLFALSVAGLQLASAFNRIATESIGFQSVIAGLMAALVLFIGHALNVALSAVSVLVHGIRLNALEFSMHMGLEWSGTPFRPFARRTMGIESTAATKGDR